MKLNSNILIGKPSLLNRVKLRETLFFNLSTKFRFWQLIDLETRCVSRRSAAVYKKLI